MYIAKISTCLRSVFRKLPMPQGLRKLLVSIYNRMITAGTGQKGWFGQESIPLIFPIGHFYSPIANPVDIRDRASAIWNNSKDMAGIDFNEAGQLALLQQLAKYPATINYPIEKPKDQSQYFYSNDQFPVLDAEMLYSMLCEFKPKAMIEVGSGFSSLITADVNRRLLANSLNFACIEPYPRQFLVDGVDGISELVIKKVEDVDLSFFNRLGEGDIMFIDSSHVSKVGSDVNYLFFEVLPRLNKGVIVHIHDIFLPDEYPKPWVIDQGRNWNEQYLLRAFLQFNEAFEVIWSSAFMGKYHHEEVKAIFSRYPKLGGGGSIWLKKVK